MLKLNRSPLFYVGDKYKLLEEILPLFPQVIDTFIEPFTGGGSVFLNVEANKYELNDIDQNVVKIHQLFISYLNRPEIFFDIIEERINRYGLSQSFKKDIVPVSLKKEFKKTYYAKFNKDAFKALKEQYNTSEEKDIIDLYILLIYGFNRMLRFNSSGHYNLPVGNVDFNTNVYKAVENYFSVLSNRFIKWNNVDFKTFLDNIEIKKNDFIYFDPPYLITFSEYNKLWNINKEKELLDYIDLLNSKNIKFALSNVITYKDKTNDLLIKWSEKYNVFPIKSNYISYHDNSIKTFEEVLITNYINPN